MVQRRSLLYESANAKIMFGDAVGNTRARGELHLTAEMARGARRDDAPPEGRRRERRPDGRRRERPPPGRSRAATSPAPSFWTRTPIPHGLTFALLAANATTNKGVAITFTNLASWPMWEEHQYQLAKDRKLHDFLNRLVVVTWDPATFSSCKNKRRQDQFTASRIRSCSTPASGAKGLAEKRSQRRSVLTPKRPICTKYIRA